MGQGRQSAGRPQTTSQPRRRIRIRHTLPAQGALGRHCPRRQNKREQSDRGRLDSLLCRFLFEMAYGLIEHGECQTKMAIVGALGRAERLLPMNVRVHLATLGAYCTTLKTMCFRRSYSFEIDSAYSIFFRILGPYARLLRTEGTLARQLTTNER